MSLAYDDGIVRAHLGDAATVLRTLPEASVQCCVTSPPYWGLRDYGCEGQLGLEATPEEWVTALVEVFREVRRVLRDDGTLWLNVGDCYASSVNGTKHDPKAPERQSARVSERSTLRGNGHVGGGPKLHDDRAFRDKPFSTVTAGLKPKDLIGLPWMLAFALRADGWYLRSDIVWHKPNPMPESVTDRPTRAHEYLFLLTKSRRYFYDADAVREPLAAKTFTTFGTGHRPQGNDALGMVKSDNLGSSVATRQPRLDASGDIAGANKRDVWTIATAPYPSAHFATYPAALVKPCILAGTSAKGCCPECGAPWMRSVDVAYDPVGRSTNGPRSVENREITAGFAQRLEKRTTSTGWTPGCDHVLEPVQATVLDPFAGSGTTLAVAKSLDRKATGIELSPAYMALLRQRCARAHAQIALPLATEGVS